MDNIIGESPCDTCEMRNHCAALTQACTGLKTFVDTGKLVEPTMPNTDIYDYIYGSSGPIRILSRAEYLSALKCEPQDKTKFADILMRNLYNSSAGDEMPLYRSDMYSDWNWFIAVADIETVPVVVAAIGYERVLDGAYISFLYTRRAYQKKGLGSELMNMVEKMHKATSLCPETPESFGFYRKRGYRPSDTSSEIWYKKCND